MESIAKEIEHLIMEIDSIVAEMSVLNKTHLYLVLFRILFNLFTNIFILWVVHFYLQKWLSRKYISLLNIGFILLLSIEFLYPEYMQRNFESLYAARSDANKCLELLRLETLKDPIKTSYSYTHGCCTAVIRLSRKAATDQAVAESQIDSLVGKVAARQFAGTTYISSSRIGSEDYGFSSLHCTNSWGGIARWIVEKELNIKEKI